MPEILLLTAISRFGRIEPTASAFSTTGPRVTGTVLKALSLLEIERLYRAAERPPATTTTPSPTSPLRMAVRLPPTSVTPQTLAGGWKVRKSQAYFQATRLE